MTHLTLKLLKMCFVLFCFLGFVEQINPTVCFFIDVFCCRLQGVTYVLKFPLNICGGSMAPKKKDQKVEERWGVDPKSIDLVPGSLRSTLAKLLRPLIFGNAFQVDCRPSSVFVDILLCYSLFVVMLSLVACAVLILEPER